MRRQFQAASVATPLETCRSTWQTQGHRSDKCFRVTCLRVLVDCFGGLAKNVKNGKCDISCCVNVSHSSTKGITQLWDVTYSVWWPTSPNSILALQLYEDFSDKATTFHHACVVLVQSQFLGVTRVTRTH